MPTYRYRCAKCGDELEQWQSFSDTPLTRHGECGGKLAKVFSTPGIVLKGSGFYRTDSRNGSKRSTKKADDDSTEKAEKTEKTEKQDAKADTKADTSTSKTSSSTSGSNGDGGKANPAKKGDAATTS